MPLPTLQQYLPFTVLKPMYQTPFLYSGNCEVATVLTVYGIETNHFGLYNFRL